MDTATTETSAPSGVREGDAAIVHASADVDPGAQLGAGARIWHLAQVREEAVVGEGSVIGRGAYVDKGVHLGRNCKVQNFALVYAPAWLGDGVFVGPAACLTNDTYPRAVSPEGALLGGDDWDMVGVTVQEGASIGARAVVRGGVRIGPWALVAAGAVVVHDVPAHALVAGVPARHLGWVDRRGRRLDESLAPPWIGTDGHSYRLLDGALIDVTGDGGIEGMTP